MHNCLDSSLVSLKVEFDTEDPSLAISKIHLFVSLFPIFLGKLWVYAYWISQWTIVNYHIVLYSFLGWKQKVGNEETHYCKTCLDFAETLVWVHYNGISMSRIFLVKISQGAPNNNTIVLQSQRKA